MANEDFDVESLAAYLHLSSSQVQKLAERGRLPGRKLAGGWRFSRAEIHHWLEDRIGLSSEEELLQVEDVLARPAGDGVEPSLAELLPETAIEIPLVCRTRGSVISAMTNVAARSGLLWDPEKLEAAVKARENLHPTALDNGVALLHPRRPMPSIVSEPFLALGRTSHGIPFGGRHGLTDIFFLICSTTDRGHLRTLARLSRLLADSSFVEQLREAPDAAAVLEILERMEEELT